MDNIDSGGLTGRENLDKPTSFGDDANQMKVSHSPLNLGGGGAAVTPRPPAPKPVAGRPMDNPAPIGRITGVKTFFTKLHAGAMEFLDEQITKWLQENPGVHIKFTNTTTGEIQGKKTEPNIIIHVWY
jgi:hypothetical protein